MELVRLRQSYKELKPFKVAKTARFACSKLLHCTDKRCFFDPRVLASSLVLHLFSAFICVWVKSGSVVHATGIWDVAVWQATSTS